MARSRLGHALCAVLRLSHENMERRWGRRGRGGRGGGGGGGRKPGGVLERWEHFVRRQLHHLDLQFLASFGGAILAFWAFYMRRRALRGAAAAGLPPPAPPSPPAPDDFAS